MNQPHARGDEPLSLLFAIAITSISPTHVGMNRDTLAAFSDQAPISPTHVGMNRSDSA